jgi:deazaflavin-dependent oxidoreductase (nitroreductase family)
MGLQEELGYTPGTRNWLRRPVVAITGTRLGTRLMAKTLTPVDRAVWRLSHGRYTATGALSGLRVLMLTTRGARSGKPRVNPVIGIPWDDDLALIASNFGGDRHPGWAYNLQARPEATLTHRGTTVPVIARLADEAETDRAIEVGATLSPTFRRYREWAAAKRRLEVFILTAGTPAR